MFDIGFSEMVVLAVVALVVLGPERLPKVAKQTGAWMGKLRRYVDDVKSDINRQMELSELRNLKNQVTDAARAWLAEQGYDPAYGARPLRRLVQREIGDRLARALLAGDVRDGQSAVVDIDPETGGLTLR